MWGVAAATALLACASTRPTRTTRANETPETAAAMRPQEGEGGKSPTPVPSDQGGQQSYAPTRIPEPGPEGRTPPSEQREVAQGNAPANQVAQTPPVDARQQLQGRVAAVLPDNEIVVDDGQVTTQVKVAPDAQITVDGKKGSFSDLKPGAEVRASLQGTPDGAQATQLQVTSAKSKK